MDNGKPCCPVCGSDNFWETDEDSCGYACECYDCGFKDDD